MSEKPTGLFLGSFEAINKAYSSEVKEKLVEKLDLIDKGYTDKQFERDELPFSEFQDVKYIFSTWNMAALTEEQIDKYFPALEAVFYAAGTVKYFAKPYLKKGIKIFSAWGANGVPVAEYTVSQIILANKGYFQTVHRGGASNWAERNNGKPYPGNYNTNIGIIGAGMIGTLVINMLKNYKLNVFVFDPFMSEERAKSLGVTKVNELKELFAFCQVISNHLANNPQTVNMINKSCFDLMGENAVFINTGRGLQVNEDDMINALKSHPDRAALLDVTYPEPPEENSPLYTMNNVFLSPHIAGSLGNEVQRMGEFMLDEFIRLTNGEKTKYEVTEKMLETMA